MPDLQRSWEDNVAIKRQREIIPEVALMDTSLTKDGHAQETAKKLKPRREKLNPRFERTQRQTYQSHKKREKQIARKTILLAKKVKSQKKFE